MTTSTDRMFPLYQGLMTTTYDHRAADVVRSPTAQKRQNQPRYLSASEHADAERLAQPMYWVSATEMPAIEDSWLLGFADVTSATNWRTVVAAAVPLVAVNHKLPIILGKRRIGLLAVLNSFVLDYVARQKVAGQNLTYTYLRQLAIPLPKAGDYPPTWAPNVPLSEWLEIRVLELSFTAWDMQPLAAEFQSATAPFVWDAHRRRTIMAELDAAFFHLYGVNRDDVEYIMETFPIVKRHDIAEHGEFLTKRLILENYDEMQRCIGTGSAFVSTLDPAPGFGPRHPERNGDE